MIHIVWENLLAVPGPRFTPALYRRRLRWRRYAAALDLWATNPAAVSAVWDLWDGGYEGIAVITYLPPQLWPHLKDRLTEEGIPHLRFLPSTPDEMARVVALRPDITQLLDGDPSHALRYGPKGCHIPPTAAHLIGKVG